MWPGRIVADRDDVMLYEFIDLNRDVIISRTRDRVRSRPWPSVAPGELEHGVPMFLTQLSETLRLVCTSAPIPPAPSVRPPRATEGICCDWALRCPRSSMIMATSAKRSRPSRSTKHAPISVEDSIPSIGVLTRQ